MCQSLAWRGTAWRERSRAAIDVGRYGLFIRSSSGVREAEKSDLPPA
jgi:hypothetical protein